MSNLDKKDLRVIKTEHLIKNTFIEMVQTLGYQRITVKDLCEKALINRNTFYLHYSDKDALVKALINEALDKFMKNLNPLSIEFFTNVITNNLEGFTSAVKKFLEIIYEDIELYRMLLIDEYLTGYFKNFELSYEKTILHLLKIKNRGATLIFRYIMSGVAGILVEWIVKDTTSMDETARIISMLVFENIKIYMKENNL